MMWYAICFGTNRMSVIKVVVFDSSPLAPHALISPWLIASPGPRSSISVKVLSLSTVSSFVSRSDGFHAVGIFARETTPVSTHWRT